MPIMNPLSLFLLFDLWIRAVEKTADEIHCGNDVTTMPKAASSSTRRNIIASPIIHSPSYSATILDLADDESYNT